MHIDSIRLFRLNAMLQKPYHTAFGDLPYFDATVAILSSGSRVAAGESTAVLGYSWESPDDVWGFVTRQAPTLLHAHVDLATGFLRKFMHNYPFGVTPLLCALEGLKGTLRPPEQNIRFPLAGILNTPHEREIPEALTALLEAGFTTIKFKIGFDVEHDIRKTLLILSLLKGRGVLRLDANQHYTLEQALRFASAVPPEGVELLEQPFAADDWESTKRFAPHCPYPLMLDESIYGDEEISRAVSEKCARAIKLKIVKSADPNELYRQSRTVLENKMDLIIGNGAATDISCCHELLVGVKAGLKAAGEMNGYVKLRKPLLPDAVKFENGCMVVAAGASLVPDVTMLQSQSVDTVTLA